MDTNYIIETKNLTKQYGSQKSVADLNIHVKRGRIYGLLGRNGAGKTTTMKMLLGLTNPTSGKVKIWGKPLPYMPKSTEKITIMTSVRIIIFSALISKIRI